MAEPLIGPTTIQWPIDDPALYIPSSGSLRFHGGSFGIEENTPARAFLGHDAGSATVWDQNDNNGVISVAGEMVNGVPAWDERASDNVSYKVILNAGAVNKFTNAIWLGSVIPTQWMVNTFWFYDDQLSVNSRRWFLGNFVAKFTPQIGIIAHPGHPDPIRAARYIFCTGFSSWTDNALTATVQESTGVLRSTGWHFLLIAGIQTAGADRRVVVLDNTIVKDETAPPSTLIMPAGTRLGTLYTGDFSVKPLYFDSLKGWNNLRYPSSVLVDFPQAKPGSLKDIISFLSSLDIASVDRRGTVALFYRRSLDGGETFSGLTSMTLLELQAEAWGGRGEDIIQPVVLLATSSSFLFAAGLMSPVISDLLLGYASTWAESPGSPKTWTEVV